MRKTLQNEQKTQQIKLPNVKVLTNVLINTRFRRFAIQKNSRTLKNIQNTRTNNNNKKNNLGHVTPYG